ncbi:MAG: PASTA domain-containing protein [Ruminococcaceae bacterium]|nr:PASTA domain-containing protein [Oscillospiraceae bacterium]
MKTRCVYCLEEHESTDERCPICGYSPLDNDEDSLYMLPGTGLTDRYIIGRTIGVGGFGVTYTAWDKKLKQKVAIKEYLPSEFSTRIPGHTHITVFSGEKSQQFYAGMRRFVDEAKNLAKFIATPGIVKVYDTFEANLTAYIVMELLEGETLAARLKRDGAIPADEALDIIIEVLGALQTVHEGGILHRDIAPDNIYLTTSGQPKLIDFGAARYATTTHSRSITVIIKKGYSPEEQYRSRGDQGPHTDVYAMGATLYKMITGETPPDALERRAQIESGRRDPLPKLRSTVRESESSFFARAINGIAYFFRSAGSSVCGFTAKIMEKLADSTSRKAATPEDESRFTRWLRSRASGLRQTSAHLVPDYVITRQQATAVMNALNIRIEDRTADAATFRNELCSAQQVARRASRINAADYFGMTRLRVVSAVAILLCVTLIGLAVAGVFRSSSDALIEIPDTMTRVPQVINMDMQLAQQAFDDAELIYQVSGNEYSDVIPADCLLSQSVSGGMVVGKNTVIDIVMSVGERTDTVPDVFGYPIGEATRILGERSFAVAVKEEYSSVVAQGCVMAQSIPAGNDYPVESTITLTVSLGYEPGTEPETETIRLPVISGLSLDELLEIAEKSDFAVSVSEKQYSAEHPENTVISSVPGDAETLNAGETLSVVLSLGEERVKVPEVLYLDEESALEILGSRKLPCSVEYEYSTTVAEGLVMDQSLNARTWVPVDTEMLIIVSLGFPPFEMPDLSDMTEDEARQTILDKGLVISVEYAQSAEVPEGSVISQSVAAGDMVTTGTVVTVRVSTGITLVTVPSVTGLSEDEAVRKLEDAGFKVEINRVYNGDVSEGKVISQSLGAGTDQIEGSTIYLNVSRGNKPVTTTTPPTAAKPKPKPEPDIGCTSTPATRKTTTTTTTTRPYTTTRPMG